MASEQKAVLLVLICGLPSVVLCLVVSWRMFGIVAASAASIAAVALWVWCAMAVRSLFIRPLQTLSNLLHAVREGDFGMRVRMTGEGGTLENVIAEANALSDTLQTHRLEATERGALLARVLAEIDVAVFAFDDAGRLVVINHAGERIVRRPRQEVIGKTAEAIGIAHFVDSEDTAVVASRWSVRRSEFRQGGLPHRLLVISDLRGALREEERQAWERLLRVLGHELNSSLAPMKSVAESLIELLRRSPRSPEWEDDARRGLQIIAQRSDALSRFLHDYARITRLPEPRFERISVREMIERIAALETRKSIEIAPGEDVGICVDRSQIEQALINLVRNAVEATPAEGAVRIEWTPGDSAIEIRVVDDGSGIANVANLFVPFFTTKAEGSGIGLTLARQIVEAHRGTLTLEKRADTHGTIARIRLPLDTKSPDRIVGIT